MSDPGRRAGHGWVADVVEIPRPPILDRDGNAVNREFSCGVPLIDLGDTCLAVTTWCRGPRDLPRPLLGLLSLKSVVDVRGDNGERTVAGGRCEERLPIPGRRVFWRDVPRQIGPLPTAATPAATP